MALYSEVRTLLMWCWDRQIVLLPTFLPGKQNVLADRLSRPTQVLNTEWTLDPHIFRLLLRAVPELEVDLFATRDNARLPRFISPFPDPLAWETDALSLQWHDLLAYAYPPTAILSEVLKKIRSEPCTVLVLAPLWQGQPWFPDLLALLIDYPIQLPWNRRLLAQQNRPVYHTQVRQLNLHAWMLSNNPFARMGFLLRLHGGTSTLHNSSLRLYQSHYSKFTGWCDTRGLTPESANVQDLADFLLYLRVDLGLAPKTISNYRSSLAATIRPLQGAVAHPVLSSLIKSFSHSAVPVRNRVPDWDLSQVLLALRSAPFEPPRWDDTTSRLYCTMKTVFLLVLASARRRGELQAISRAPQDIVFSARGVSLRTVAGFLPKSAIPGHDPLPFFIPSLAPFSGRDSGDRLLCPVRMLKFYLQATGGYRQDARLFYKLKGDTPVSSQTISAWIVRCIRSAVEDPSVPASAHEVRRLAASWAYVSGVHRLDDILTAGSWASHNTFSSFYLADVRPQADDRFRLCPVVAGRQISL